MFRTDFLINGIQSICVEDFCGTWRGYPVQFWADYYPSLLTTYFGGDWYFVPPLHSDECPTDEIVKYWADYHEAML